MVRRPRNAPLLATVALLLSTAPYAAPAAQSPATESPATESAAVSRTDTAACRATAEVRPATAVVGQQILYRVRIVRRQDVEKVDWVRGLSFPDFRTEWLPGHAEDTPMRYRGMTFVAREEDRALFPTRAGVFEIPQASLRCTIAGRGPDPARSEILRVPPVRVRIVNPPTEGRPNDFRGAVGPLWIQTSVGAPEIRLGESLSVSILVRGAGNLWDLPRPLADDTFDAEVFWRPPEIELEAGEQLYVRRYFRFDLVPHKVGPLLIPAVRVPFYDFRTGHYEVAAAEAISVNVLPRASGPDLEVRGAKPTHAARSDELGRARETEAGGDPSGWIATGALSLSCLAITLGAGALRRRRDWTPTREALIQAEEARAADDPKAEAAALSRALYGALAVTAPDLDTPSPETLRRSAAAQQNADLITAADALDALERARFSGDPNDGGKRDALAAVELLRARSRQRRWRTRR